MMYEQPFKIFYCGRESCLPGHSFGPAIRKQYLIHFVLAGRGEFHVGGTTYELSAGDAFLIRPGEVTYYQADQNEPWTYAWMAFAGDQADSILAEVGFGVFDHIGEFCHIDMIDRLLDELQQSFENPAEGEFGLTGYFFLIVNQLQARATERDKSNLFAAALNRSDNDRPIAHPHTYDQRYLAKARSIMRDNFAYPITIANVARLIGIDRTYLYRIFMHYEKRSPKQYLTALRIKAAREMLLETDHSLAEIALSCGFYDSSAFCRTFADYEGMTPGQYRKRTL